MCQQKYRRSNIFVTRGHTNRVIFTVKICIFQRSNEESHFSKTKIYFPKKAAPQLLGLIGLQNIKVGVKTNFGWLAKMSEICSMDTDIPSYLDWRKILTHFGVFDSLWLLFANKSYLRPCCRRKNLYYHFLLVLVFHSFVLGVYFLVFH